MAARFSARETGIAHIEVRTLSDLAAELPPSDVLVVSQMWRNELAAGAEKLRFIQSISAGVDQYDQELLRARGVRLASAAGITTQAVAEHAMALILALRRHLHTGRDNQAQALAGHDLGHPVTGRSAWRQDAPDHRTGAHRDVTGEACQRL